MCQACYDEAGRPWVGETECVVRAASLIRDLYDRPGCLAGGPMHIVTDDDNVEIEENYDPVAWCLENPEAWKLVDEEDPEQAVSLAVAFAVGLALLQMSEAERWTVLALVWGYNHERASLKGVQ